MRLLSCAVIFNLLFCAFAIRNVSAYSPEELIANAEFSGVIRKSDLISSFITKDKLYEINQDFYKTHELMPNGVPAGYDWFKGPRIGAGNRVGSYTAATGWGQVFWAKGIRTSSDFLQIRNFNFFVCHGNQHKWMLLQNGRIEGRQFDASFSNNTNKPATYFDSKDGIATVSFEKGTAFHFWPSQGQVSLPSKDICGVLVLLEARVAPRPEKSEIGSRTFLIGTGADYWTKINSKWDKYKTNTDIAIGRLKLVHQEWEWYGMSTASDDDINRFYDEGYKVGPSVK